MPEATDEKQRFYQNLVDIGCEPDLIRYCMQLKDEYRLQELLVTFRRQRRKLMDNIHMGQKKVDCLDYLVKQIEKEEKAQSESKIK